MKGGGHDDLAMPQRCGNALQQHAYSRKLCPELRAGRGVCGGGGGEGEQEQGILKNRHKKVDEVHDISC